MNFEPIFEPSDTEKQEFTRRHDLSDLIAEIDVLCFRLDFYELGRWWDYAAQRRKLTHPAIVIWMNRHGFNSFADLPTPAIASLCANLRKYLDAAAQISASNPIQAIEGGKDA